MRVYLELEAGKQAIILGDTYVGPCVVNIEVPDGTPDPVVTGYVAPAPAVPRVLTPDKQAQVDAILARRAALAALISSDGPSVRVLEDLIDLLIDKGLIALGDLPQAAQERLSARSQLRQQLTAQG